MMFQWYSGGGSAVHPLLVVMLAFAIDVVVGDPPKVYARLPHPVALFGGLVGFAERKLNRERRSDRARFWRGQLATCVLVTAAGAVGYGLQAGLARLDFGWLIGAALASTLIALLKNTSVAGVFGVIEAAAQMKSFTNDFASERWGIFLAFALGYIILVEVVSLLATILERRWRIA